MRDAIYMLTLVNKSSESIRYVLMLRLSIDITAWNHSDYFVNICFNRVKENIREDLNNLS